MLAIAMAGHLGEGKPSTSEAEAFFGMPFPLSKTLTPSQHGLGLPCNALPQEVSTSEDNAFVRVKQLVTARTVQSDRLRSKRSVTECRIICAAFGLHAPKNPHIRSFGGCNVSLTAWSV